MTTDLELYHYGVKGMKWGVRQARQAGRELDRKKRAYTQAKRARNRAVSRDTGYDDIARKTANYTQAKADYRQAKREFNENAPNRVKVERGVRKTAAALGKIGMMYVADQKFLGGVGTAATKIAAQSAVKVIGMTAVTAYTMARGGTNIKWKV